MPIYEFVCPGCGRKQSLLVKSFTQTPGLKCSVCGDDMKRAISKFAHHKSQKDRREEYHEPNSRNNPDYYQDPRNIGRWTEKRMKELGVDMPDSVRGMIDAAREGELPDSLKEEL